MLDVFSAGAPSASTGSPIAGSQQGFSLLELMIAAAMTGGLFLMGAAGMSMLSTGSVQLSKKAQKTSDFGSFASSFSRMMESAGIAVQFQHLPVRVPNGTCPTTDVGPYVRKLDQQEFACDPTLSIQDYANSNVSYIEFFRDHSGILNKDASVLVGGGNNPANPADTRQMISSPAINITSALSNSDYYATWPLIDENSEPFFLFRTAQSEVVLNYLYCHVGADSDSDCGGTPTGQNERFSTQSSLTQSDLVGLLILLYNSKDPAQFFFQRVTAATLVSTSGAIPQIWDLTLDSIDSAAGLTGGNYGNFTNASTEATLFGTMTSLSWGNAAGSGSWSLSQPVAIYQVPTHEVSADVLNPGGPNFILRRWADYLDSKYPDKFTHPRIVAIPALATAFKLQPSTVPQGCPVSPCPTSAGQIPAGCPVDCLSYRLTAQTFVGDGAGADLSQPVVMMDGIFKTTPNYDFRLVFARKLGTTTISIFTSSE